MILLRTMNGWAENFKKILESRGIPASVTTKTGYFSAQEVVTVLNYLRILDNPLQDIPFAGVLLNLPDAFTMEELAKIKCAGKEVQMRRLNSLNVCCYMRKQMERQKFKEKSADF